MSPKATLSLALLVLTACALPGTASARHGSPAIPRDRGVVTGRIDLCEGMPIRNGPRSEPGTVTVLKGRATWTHTRHRGYRWIFPTPIVARQTVKAGAAYRFVLPPGPYVLRARFAFPSNIFPFLNVTVKAGKVLHASIPNSCK
jgi:hypothetical protein